MHCEVAAEGRRTEQSRIRVTWGAMFLDSTGLCMKVDMSVSRRSDRRKWDDEVGEGRAGDSRRRQPWCSLIQASTRAWIGDDRPLSDGDIGTWFDIAAVVSCSVWC